MTPWAAGDQGQYTYQASGLKPVLFACYLNDTGADTEDGVGNAKRSYLAHVKGAATVLPIQPLKYHLPSSTCSSFKAKC